MKSINIPKDYQAITAYLILSDALSFIQFMQNIFDTELIHKAIRDGQKIMHAELRIGDITLM